MSAPRFVRRLRNAYHRARQRGDGRLAAFRWALMIRRSSLGPRGWR